MLYVVMRERWLMSCVSSRSFSSCSCCCKAATPNNDRGRGGEGDGWLITLGLELDSTGCLQPARGFYYYSMLLLPHLPTCNMQLGPSPSFLYNLHLCLLLSVPSPSPPLLSHLHCAVSTLFSSYIRSLTTTRLWLLYRFLRGGGRERNDVQSWWWKCITYIYCLSLLYLRNCCFL